MRRLSRREFKTLFQKVPRVTVDVVIKDRRGILLIKRSITPDKGKWHLPGGTVFHKENLLHAVKRKVKEETGLKIKIKKLLGVLEFMRWKEAGYTHIITPVFLAEPIGGELQGDSKTAGSELRFFKKLPKKMVLEHKKLFEGKLIK